MGLAASWHMDTSQIRGQTCVSCIGRRILNYRIITEALMRTFKIYLLQFSSVQSLSPVRIYVTTGTAARQASLSITNSRSLLRLMSIKLVMPLLEAIILANTSRTRTRSQGLQCGSPALPLLQMT